MSHYDLIFNTNTGLKINEDEIDEINTIINTSLLWRDGRNSMTGDLNVNENSIVNIDNLDTETITLGNTLITATSEEINKLDRVELDGVVEASKVLIADVNRNITNLNEVSTTSIRLNNTLITATSEEINKLDRVELDGVVESSKVLIADVNRNITNLNEVSATNVNCNTLTVETFSILNDLKMNCKKILGAFQIGYFSSYPTPYFEFLFPSGNPMENSGYGNTVSNVNSKRIVEQVGGCYTDAQRGVWDFGNDKSLNGAILLGNPSAWGWWPTRPNYTFNFWIYVDSNIYDGKKASFFSTIDPSVPKGVAFFIHGSTIKFSQYGDDDYDATNDVPIILDKWNMITFVYDRDPHPTSGYILIWKWVNTTYYGADVSNDPNITQESLSHVYMIGSYNADGEDPGATLNGVKIANFRLITNTKIFLPDIQNIYDTDYEGIINNINAYTFNSTNVTTNTVNSGIITHPSLVTIAGGGNNITVDSAGITINNINGFNRFFHGDSVGYTSIGGISTEVARFYNDAGQVGGVHFYGNLNMNTKNITSCSEISNSSLFSIAGGGNSLNINSTGLTINNINNNGYNRFFHGNNNGYTSIGGISTEVARFYNDAGQVGGVHFYGNLNMNNKTIIDCSLISNGVNGNSIGIDASGHTISNYDINGYNRYFHGSLGGYTDIGGLGLALPTMRISNNDTILYKDLNMNSNSINNIRALYINGGSFITSDNSDQLYIRSGAGRYINIVSSDFITLASANNNIIQLVTMNHIIMNGPRVIPQTDNLTSLGLADYAWSNIYTVVAPVITSDLRKKTEIKDTTLGLEFINKLRPVSYKLKVGQMVQTEEDEYLHDDGVWKREKIETTPDKIRKYSTERAGVRPHQGLISQEVKKVMDDMGIDDFAGYIHDKESDNYGLRYEEFISPMIKAIQELSDKVAHLEAQLSDRQV